MKLPVIIVHDAIIFFYDKTEAARGFKPLVSKAAEKNYRISKKALRMKKNKYTFRTVKTFLCAIPLDCLKKYF